MGKQYKKSTISFRSLGSLIRTESKKVREYFGELGKYKKDIDNGKYNSKTLEDYKKTVNKLIAAIENIKKYSRRIIHQENEEVSEVLNWCDRYGVFPQINNNKNANPFEKRFRVVIDFINHIVYNERIDEKRVLRGRYPKESIIARYHSGKRIFREEKKGGKRIRKAEKEAEDSYDYLKKNINNVEENKKEIRNNLREFINSLLKEIRATYKEYINAEILEIRLEKEFEDLEKSKDQNVKNLGKDVKDQLTKRIRKDVRESLKMKREEKAKEEQSEEDLKKSA